MRRQPGNQAGADARFVPPYCWPAALACRIGARICFTQLGREIGLSRTAVQDRVARLEQRGAIRGYYADIGPDRGGTIEAVLFVEIARRPCGPVLDWLASLEGVSEVMSLAGDTDALVRCSLSSPAALTVLNDRIGASDLIRSSKAHLVLGRR